MDEEKIQNLKDNIGAFKDFPKPGIIFRDIFPLFQDPNHVRLIVDHLSAKIKEMAPDTTAVVGLDARGFLIGPMIAVKLGVSFVPVRKKGKLPGPTSSVNYEKEYGLDSLEVQRGSLGSTSKVVVVDDLLATGGTALGAYELISNVIGAEVNGFFFMIELEGIGGRDKLREKRNTNIYSIFKFQE